MSDAIIFLAFFAFALFFVAGNYRRYAAITGWICIVLNLVSELPAIFAEANFLYPALALLSLPFLIITIRHLLNDDPIAIRLSTTAAVATIIFVPFALVPFLRDALIGVVINLVFILVSALGYSPSWHAWDIITRNGFYNQIILGCTSILAIAIMAGVIAGVPDITVRQRLRVIIPVALLLFFLNLFRVAGVFIAVSCHWFNNFPDPTGTGDPNFFWAHNVIAEALEILFLLLLVVLLCRGRVLPGLFVYAKDVVNLYFRGIRSFLHNSLR
jgi:archaeosortase A (PGF-CTERM-specific)